MSILGLNSNSSYIYGDTGYSDITVEQINLEDGSMYDLFQECDDAVHEVFLAIYEADCIELQGKANLLLTEGVGISEFEYLLMEADTNEEPADPNADKESKAVTIKNRISDFNHKAVSKIKYAVGKIMDAVISILSSMQTSVEQFSMDVAKKAKKIYGDGKFKKTPEIKGYDYPIAEDVPDATELFMHCMTNPLSDTDTDVSSIVNSAAEDICGFAFTKEGFKELKKALYGSESPITIKFSESECNNIYNVLSKGSLRNLVGDLRKQIANCRADYRRLTKDIYDNNISNSHLRLKALNMAKSGYVKALNMLIAAAKGKSAQGLKVLKIAYGSKSDDGEE